jgi:hypothetical protein
MKKAMKYQYFHFFEQNKQVTSANHSCCTYKAMKYRYFQFLSKTSKLQVQIILVVLIGQ